LLAGLAFIIAPRQAILGQTISDSDFVYISSAVLQPNRDTSFSVVVSLQTKTQAGGIVIPLSFGWHPDLLIDTTVVTAGEKGVTYEELGLNSQWTLKVSQVDNAARTITIGFISFGSGLPPSTGPLVRVHFRLKATLQPAIVFVDSTMTPPANYLEIMDPNANNYKPQFTRGEINIGYGWPYMELVSPPAGSGISERRPTLIWRMFRDTITAEPYDSALILIEQGVDPVTTDTFLVQSDTSWIFPDSLAPLTKIAWRVISYKDSGDSAFSPKWVFLVNYPWKNFVAYVPQDFLTVQAALDTSETGLMFDTIQISPGAYPGFSVTMQALTGLPFVIRGAQNGETTYINTPVTIGTGGVGCRLSRLTFDLGGIGPAVSAQQTAYIDSCVIIYLTQGTPPVILGS
jgi:hypothetical protein